MFTELSERIDICRQRFEKTLQTPELKTPVKNPVSNMTFWYNHKDFGYTQHEKN
jgi:hypothetical protein